MTKVIRKIYQCPECKTYQFDPVKSNKYIDTSYFIGRGLWSDGTSRLVYYNGGTISQCVSCSEFFINYSSMVATTTDPLWTCIPIKRKETPEDLPDSADSMAESIPLTLQNFNELESSQLWKQKEIFLVSELGIRMDIWSIYNSLSHEREFGDEDNNEKIIDHALESANIKNLKVLALLMESIEPDNYLLRAEIQRHLGNFKQSKKLLLNVPLDDIDKIIQIKARIKKGSRISFLFARSTMRYRNFYVFKERLRRFLWWL
jgi:hypothetical protein